MLTDSKITQKYKIYYNAKHQILTFENLNH